MKFDSSQTRKAFLLALVSVNGIGPKTVQNILKFCQQNDVSEREFLDNKDDVWQKISLSEKTIESIKKFNKEHNFIDNLNELQTSGVGVLSFEDKAYPKLLLETDSFPPILFVKSKIEIGSQDWDEVFSKTISVVGTRNITSYGRLVIREIIPSLVSVGKTVVSGFMYGVDLLSAKQALKVGGKTIAVLGFGFDHCFPSNQSQEMEDFLEQGAVFLSEFPRGTEAKASNFVRRNRIVAGLSPATLVVEAASRSGSHITAAYANDYGRIVMAVPGPITNPFSEGTKKLINQGAVLVNDAGDILRELAESDYFFRKSDSNKRSLNETNDNAGKLLDELSFCPQLSFEQLMQNLQLSSGELNQLLFDLELQGRIIKKWGKYCLLR